MELPDNTLILVSQEQFDKLLNQVAGLQKHMESLSKSSGLGYISVKAACKQLDCTKAFVYSLIKKGVIRRLKLGSRTLISIREMEEAIENGKG